MHEWLPLPHLDQRPTVCEDVVPIRGQGLLLVLCLETRTRRAGGRRGEGIAGPGFFEAVGGRLCEHGVAVVHR
eukprot:scaffold2808_cov255-Pinguiococcus_pyrenoidosus.AAC.34